MQGCQDLGRDSDKLDLGIERRLVKTEVDVPRRPSGERAGGHKRIGRARPKDFATIRTPADHQPAKSLLKTGVMARIRQPIRIWAAI